MSLCRVQLANSLTFRLSMLPLYVVGAQHVECVHGTLRWLIYLFVFEHYFPLVPSLWHHQSGHTCLSGFGL